MKTLVLAVLTFGLLSNASRQRSPTPHADVETKGICSPIAPNNQGTITITCTGFSDKQNRQILDFLHQLSIKQAGDQDALLSKLDEIIAAVKATQRQSSPRIITGEVRQQILRSNWGVCATEKVVIVAPTKDGEAQSLAEQIKKILDGVGMQPKVVYDEMKKVPGNTEDLKISTSSSGGYCTTRFLGGNIGSLLSVGFDSYPDSAKSPASGNGTSLDSAATVYIYVYSR